MHKSKDILSFWLHVISKLLSHTCSHIDQNIIGLLRSHGETEPKVEQNLLSCLSNLHPNYMNIEFFIFRSCVLSPLPPVYPGSFSHCSRFLPSFPVIQTHHPLRPSSIYPSPSFLFLFSWITFPLLSPPCHHLSIMHTKAGSTYRLPTPHPGPSPLYTDCFHSTHSVLM